MSRDETAVERLTREIVAAEERGEEAERECARLRDMIREHRKRTEATTVPFLLEGADKRLWAGLGEGSE